MPLFQHTPLSEQQPSAEQIAELIADQDFYPVSVRNWQNESTNFSTASIIFSLAITREKSLTQQNERDKQTTQQVTTNQQELVKSPTQFVSPQNERELTPSPN
ncbi:unnamed protein product [Rhizophagus irregularis]|nr:unnamed protein product [Rhizophagus irregularis]